MKNDTSPEAISRARFWKLLADKEAIQAQSASLRAEYDALRKQEADLQAKQKDIADQFKAIEAPLFALDMERSKLAQALGGKTGARPAA